MPFLTVRRHLSFSRAADELAVPQPAVSRLISRLESRLGLVLFERTSHRVQITAAGESLAPVAQAALDAVEDFEAHAVQLRGGGGLLRIGTTQGFTKQVRALLKEFRHIAPGVEIRLEPGNTPRKMQRLQQGGLDVAFVRNPDESTSGLRFVAVDTAPLLAAVAREHPLAAAESVTLSQLADYPFMITPEVVNPGVHHAVMAIFTSAGVDPRLGPPLLSEADALAQIAASTAWTMLAESSLRPHGDEVAGVPIADPTARTTVSLAWRPSGLSPPAEAFVALVSHNDRRAR